MYLHFFYKRQVKDTNFNPIFIHCSFGINLTLKHVMSEIESFKMSHITLIYMLLEWWKPIALNNENILTQFQIGKVARR